MPVKRASQLGSRDLQWEVRLERKEEVSDGAGNTRGPWQPQVTRRAYIGMLLGGEEVLASRLEGTQTAAIIVRYDDTTKVVTADWRAIEIQDDGAEREFAVRSAEDVDHDKRWITMLCQAGVAA